MPDRQGAIELTQAGLVQQLESAEAALTQHSVDQVKYIAEAEQATAQLNASEAAGAKDSKARPGCRLPWRLARRGR